MRTPFVGQLDSVVIRHARFSRLVVGALFTGGLTAACLGAAASFLTSLAGGGSVVENIVDGLQIGTFVFIGTMIAGFFLSIFPFGPVAYALARYAYRRNVRQSTTYALLGAATTALLPGVFVVGALLTDGLSKVEWTAAAMTLVYTAWFTISGAAGGMAFAKRLNREERGENIANVF